MRVLYGRHWTSLARSGKERLSQTPADQANKGNATIVPIQISERQARSQRPNIVREH